MTVLLTICLLWYREEDKRLCVGNDDKNDRTNVILYKK